MIDSYMRQVVNALEDPAIDLRGVMHWSLTDNWECVTSMDAVLALSSVAQVGAGVGPTLWPVCLGPWVGSAGAQGTQRGAVEAVVPLLFAARGRRKPSPACATLSKRMLRAQTAAGASFGVRRTSSPETEAPLLSPHRLDDQQAISRYSMPSSQLEPCRMASKAWGDSPKLLRPSAVAARHMLKPCRGVDRHPCQCLYARIAGQNAAQGQSLQHRRPPPSRAPPARPCTPTHSREIAGRRWCSGPHSTARNSVPVNACTHSYVSLALAHVVLLIPRIKTPAPAAPRTLGSRPCSCAGCSAPPQTATPRH